MRDMTFVSELMEELMETIDNWVDNNVAYNDIWDDQIKALSQFPGLENQGKHIEARLKMAMETDVYNPYTVALIDTLIITLESIKKEN